MAQPWQIRSLQAGDLAAVETVLRAAGFSSQVGALLHLPITSPFGAVFGCDAGGALAGVTAAIAFPGGRSGWIGAVGVRPAARRRGIARALTEATVSWLREQGAETVSLYATDLGRPLYEQLGFVSEGNTVAWRGVGRGQAGPNVRPLVESDRDRIAVIDHEATGEDRSAIFDLLRPLEGLATTDDGGAVRGFSLRTPWGTASPALATDAEHGLALLAAATSPPRGGTLIVPENNAAASAAVREWRLSRLNEAVRMRLGPQLNWRPDRQFGTFNLFWG